jgi:hypothetical protein
LEVVVNPACIVANPLCNDVNSLCADVNPLCADFQQTVNIVAKDFTHNGQSLDPSLLGAGTMLTGRCALPNNREGVFFIVWH